MTCINGIWFNKKKIPAKPEKGIEYEQYGEN